MNEKVLKTLEYYKIIKKRGYNIDLLKQTIQLIAAEKPISPKYKEHYLTGNYKRFSRVSYTTWLALNL